MGKSRVKYLGAALIALAGLFPVCVEAGQILPVLPPGTSDYLVVYDGKGAQVELATLSDADEAAIFPNIVRLTTAGDPTLFFSPIILTELDSNGQAIFSDLFGSCPTGPNNDAVLCFSSDVNTLILPIPPIFPFIQIPEGNGQIDATFFLAPALRQQGYHAFFVSDSVAAPEPATLALFGSGLAGLGALRRRKARRKT